MLQGNFLFVFPYSLQVLQLKIHCIWGDLACRQFFNERDMYVIECVIELCLNFSQCVDTDFTK
jgi:hypothetical protein